MRRGIASLIFLAAILAAGACEAFDIADGNAVVLVGDHPKTTIKTAFDSFVPRSVMKSGDWRPELAVSYTDTILVLPKAHLDDDSGDIYYISLSGGAKGSDVAKVDVIRREEAGRRGHKVLGVLPVGKDGRHIPVFANGSGMFHCQVARRDGVEGWNCDGEYPAQIGKIHRRLIYISSTEGREGEIPSDCKEFPGETLITRLLAGRKAIACGYVRVEGSPE